MSILCKLFRHKYQAENLGWYIIGIRTGNRFKYKCRRKNCNALCNFDTSTRKSAYHSPNYAYEIDSKVNSYISMDVSE